MSTTPTNLKPIFAEGSLGPHYQKKLIHKASTDTPCTEFGSYAATEYTDVTDCFDSITKTDTSSRYSMKSNHNYGNTMYMLQDTGDELNGDDLTVIFDDDCMTGEILDVRVSNGAKFHINQSTGELSIHMRAKHKVDRKWFKDGFDEVNAVIKSLEDGKLDSSSASADELELHGISSAKNKKLNPSQQKDFLSKFMKLMKASTHGSGANIGYIGDWDHDYNPNVYNGFANFVGNYIKTLRRLQDEQKNPDSQRYKELQTEIDAFSSTLRENFGYRLSQEIIYATDNYPSESSSQALNPVEELVKKKEKDLESTYQNKSTNFQEKLASLDSIIQPLGISISQVLARTKDVDGQEEFLTDYSDSYAKQLNKLLQESGKEDITIQAEDLKSYIIDENDQVKKLDTKGLLAQLGLNQSSSGTKNSNSQVSTNPSQLSLEDKLAAIKSVEINGKTIDTRDIVQKMKQEIKAVEAKIQASPNNKANVAKAIIKMFEDNPNYHSWIKSIGGKKAIVEAILNKLE